MYDSTVVIYNHKAFIRLATDNDFFLLWMELLKSKECLVLSLLEANSVADLTNALQWFLMTPELCWLENWSMYDSTAITYDFRAFRNKISHRICLRRIAFVIMVT